MAGLKPCSFCGGNALLSSCMASTNKRTIRGTFECNNCGARISLKTQYREYAMAALDEAWDRRSEDGK